MVQNKLPGNDGNQPHYLDFQAETLKRRKGYIQRGGGGTAISVCAAVKGMVFKQFTLGEGI